MASRFEVTLHAAKRYLERVKPGLLLDDATVEVGCLAEMAEWRSEAPSWARVACDPGDMYSEPCPGLCFVANEGRVVTVIARGGHNEEITLERRDRKRRRRRDKALKRAGSKVEEFERRQSRPRDKSWKDAA